MDYSKIHSVSVTDFSGSLAYRDKAVKVLAKGVSSTPRAAQLPVPPVIVRGEGAIVTDIDGNRYIDYTLGYGPLILGHSPKGVIEAAKTELDKGLRTATIHQGEMQLAQMIKNMVPCSEVTSFVSSGTEAVQLALRIARAYTQKIPIIKFRANYHGWFDNIHVANSIGIDGPSSQGQDPRASESITLIDWGDTVKFEQVLNSSFAAVILEAAAINAGCFMPPKGFLEKVRSLTEKHNVVLIFDEVISGFRLSAGGAQQLFGVTPDIAVLGKALGAGFPISAVTGRKDMMSPLIDGRVLHRGTFNGNPVSIGASIACLKYLEKEKVNLYPRINAYALELQQHINSYAKEKNADICCNSVGSALQLFVGTRDMSHIMDLPKANKVKVLKLTQAFVQNGLMPLPRGLMYLSAAHTQDQIDATKEAICRAITQFIECEP